MAVTLKEIAQKAGVSIGTVSRVVKKKPGVSPETRRKIEQICTELNYTSNSAGRSLFLKKTKNVVAVIISHRNNTFSQELIRGFKENETIGTEYNVFFEYFLVSQASEHEMLSVLESVFSLENLKGIIIRTSSSEEIKEKISTLNTNHIPIITCVTDITGIERLCFVGSDNHAEGRLAAGMLKVIHKNNVHVGLVYGSLKRLAQKQKVDSFLSTIEESFGAGAVAFQLEITDQTRIYKETYKQLMLNEVNSLFILTDVDPVALAVRNSGIADKNQQFVSFTFTTRANAKRLFTEGLIQFAISQNAYESSLTAINMMISHLLGTPLNEKECIVPSEILLPENTI